MIKFKKLHENAVLPTRANRYDGGLDLTAVSVEVTREYIEYDTGLAVEIPEGYVGLLCPRSSVTKTGLMLGNSIGICDAPYRGPLKLRFKDVDRHLRRYEVGERVGQLVVVPILTHDAVFVDELSDTDRGQGAFGSSGN
jgi:dUTP pyrophosphatase